jgi:leucyl/phenylalanyl-tRNA--protein transferase
MVLDLSRFKVSRSLVKTVRRVRREARWRIFLDRNFEAVMDACAAPREHLGDGTWITPQIKYAYCDLHRQGFAHSVEICDEDNSLVGGLYGVSIGRMFYGESMFARAPDVSKIALYALVDLLRAHGFRVIDCQQNTRHLASLGAREIPRSSFVTQLSELAQLPDPDWSSVRIEVSGA